jgi:hypothetical protein
MKNIDFFGCSFTEAPIWPRLPNFDKFDLEAYSVHCQTTKPISNFVEFDLAYNNNKEYKVNNFGGGSFGNHVIKEILKNRIKEIDKQEENIGIVQLSALLRNEASFEGIFNSENSSLKKGKYYNITAFDILPQNVRMDYFIEETTQSFLGSSKMEDFYLLHIENLKEILNLLKQNYKHSYIYFGWDIFTNDFKKLFKEESISSEIKTWNYNFKLNRLAYFENRQNYNEFTKICKGENGGLLEYASNKLNEGLRYNHITQDHHPSYFSNKIFYIDIIREFLKPILNLSKNYFELENLIKFENYLAELIPTKESTDGRIYADFEMKLIKFIRENNLV